MKINLLNHKLEITGHYPCKVMFLSDMDIFRDSSMIDAYIRLEGFVAKDEWIEFRQLNSQSDADSDNLELFW